MNVAHTAWSVHAAAVVVVVVVSVVVITTVVSVVVSVVVAVVVKHAAFPQKLGHNVLTMAIVQDKLEHDGSSFVQSTMEQSTPE